MIIASLVPCWVTEQQQHQIITMNVVEVEIKSIRKEKDNNQENHKWRWMYKNSMIYDTNDDIDRESKDPLHWVKH